MNRTIKFRAISMCKGEHWLYGDIRHYNRNPHTEKWTIYDPEIGLETDIDENTIGQFTGLHDKDGKEIYEGDIVKCGEFIYSVNYDSVRFASFVLNRKKDFFFHYFGEAMTANECEVIGNIYDNLNLIQ